VVSFSFNLSRWHWGPISVRRLISNKGISKENKRKASAQASYKEPKREKIPRASWKKVTRHNLTWQK
jgi:hypothetical protein